MKQLIALFCFALASGHILAQPVKRLYAFPITNYVVNASDSVSIVQLELSSELKIDDKTFGILKTCYSANDTGNTQVGSGACYLIKGNYYYFGMNLENPKLKPKAGDLVYTYVKTTSLYDDLLYKVARHSIVLKTVYDSALYTHKDIILNNTQEKEKVLLQKMVADIHYTGKAMKEQNDNQDQAIKNGRFKDKALFATMQTISETDVRDFLEYVVARPVKYAGNDWKIAEIFATWMVSGTPTVVKN